MPLISEAYRLHHTQFLRKGWIISLRANIPQTSMHSTIILRKQKKNKKNNRSLQKLVVCFDSDR